MVLLKSLDSKKMHLIVKVYFVIDEFNKITVGVEMNGDLVEEEGVIHFVEMIQEVLRSLDSKTVQKIYLSGQNIFEIYFEPNKNILLYQSHPEIKTNEKKKLVQ